MKSMSSYTRISGLPISHSISEVKCDAFAEDALSPAMS